MDELTGYDYRNATQTFERAKARMIACHERMAEFLAELETDVQYSPVGDSTDVYHPDYDRDRVDLTLFNIHAHAQGLVREANELRRFTDRSWRVRG